MMLQYDEYAENCTVGDTFEHCGNCNSYMILIEIQPIAVWIFTDDLCAIFYVIA